MMLVTPHIHIVTTNIQRMANESAFTILGRNQSEKARLEIEAEFKLVKAQKHQHSIADEIKRRFVPKSELWKNRNQESHY
jgi:hypothetical protein